MYGFGVLLLDAYEVTEHRHGDMVRSVERRLGYLTPEEMGVVLALCMRPRPSRFAFRSTAARGAYAWGKAYVGKHFGWPPLSWAPFSRRVIYRIRRDWALRSGATDAQFRGRPYVFQRAVSLRVLFRCPLCAQALRVPVGAAVLAATCKSCSFAFDVRP
jgi:hypothetical protein